MGWHDILIAQLTDPFRIGLMAALGWTTLRLKRDTGVLVPLAAGAVFFAVMLPMTVPISGAGVNRQMVMGVVTHLILLAVFALGWILLQRFRGKSGEPPVRNDAEQSGTDDDRNAN